MARTHGKGSTYMHGGCRCDPCKDAHAALMASQRKNRLTRPQDIPHGLSGHNNWGCRCQVCREASTAYGDGDWDSSRTGSRWTAEDLELAVRADLSLAEAAKMMRRSYRSVVMKRHVLRRSA